LPRDLRPVIIEVAANGATYDELRVEGGVTRQTLLFSLSTAADTFAHLKIAGRGQAWVIRKSKLDPTWEPVYRRIFSIAGAPQSAR
jgi:hypothetical protein